MARQIGRVLVLAVTLSLSTPSVVAAATRYAAPGGTGTDPCANPARPCPIGIAASNYAPGSTLEAGDVVEVAPGTYSELAREIGEIATVAVPAGVTVRGEPGEARPVFVLRQGEFSGLGVFYVPTGAEVADVEIRNRSGNGSAIHISGGTIDRVIARSMQRYEGVYEPRPEPTCNFSHGIIRSSACLSSAGGRAIGVNLGSKGTFAGVIRNSTLIATGPDSVGMEFIYSAFKKRRLTAEIRGVGVLVEGGAKDVVAIAGPLHRNGGSTVSIALQASSYRTVETEAPPGGRASITPSGTNGNITMPPLLAADNLHQLPGSPTVDRGAIDGASGALDVDRQPWTIGGLPDIGADELGPLASRANPVPATELGKRPPLELGFERLAEFTFGSSEPGSRFECKLDRERFRACSSPYRKRVTLGEHTFQVRALDPQGQIDRTPAVFRWQVVSRRYWHSRPQ